MYSYDSDCGLGCNKQIGLHISKKNYKHKGLKVL